MTDKSRPLRDRLLFGSGGLSITARLRGDILEAVDTIDRLNATAIKTTRGRNSYISLFMERDTLRKCLEQLEQAFGLMTLDTWESNKTRRDWAQARLDEIAKLKQKGGIT